MTRQNDDPQITDPTLSALGNIISRSVSQTEVIELVYHSSDFRKVVLKSKEFLPRVIALLSHNRNPVKKNVCKVIADVITHSQQDLPLILKNPDCMKMLINIAESGQADVFPLILNDSSLLGH